jgi:hypothetical protein
VSDDERFRTDFLDFPTAWRVQRLGLEHATRKCSAVQGDGAFLCDCGAVAIRWAELVEAQGDPRPDIVHYLPTDVIAR